MTKDIALIILKDELDYRRRQIEFYNIKIERNRLLLAEQKVRMSKLITKIENLEKEGTK